MSSMAFFQLDVAPLPFSLCQVMRLMMARRSPITLCMEEAHLQSPHM